MKKLKNWKTEIELIFFDITKSGIMVMFEMLLVKYVNQQTSEVSKRGFLKGMKLKNSPMNFTLKMNNIMTKHILNL